VAAQKIRKSLVAAELLERAARLFAERGYSATSLEDVARQTGMSRPALYYYFKSKEDVLARLVEGLIASSELALKRIRAESSGQPEAELPELLARRYLDIRRQIVREVGAIVAAGMGSGSFRQANERVATFTVLGMCNWVAWWYEPSRYKDVGGLAAEIAEMAIASVRVDGEREPPASPAALIKAIRGHLSRLERLAEG
jgi:AcrR family transcriptional regulator